MNLNILPNIDYVRIAPFLWGKILTNATFWTMLCALFALLGLLGIYFVLKQLRLSAWANAQEIFMAPDFVNARTIVLQYFDEPVDREPSTAAKITAKLVCRRMDALCRLADKKFISKCELFKTWGYPLAKSWIIIQERWKMVSDEIEKCQKHKDKWEPFCRIGREAADRLYPDRNQ